MRHIFACLALLFTLSLWGQNRIEFPEIALTGEKVEFTLHSNEELSYVLINNANIDVTQKGNIYTGSVILNSSEIVLNEGYEHNSPMVIPGWLSLLPPLIAIALALLFKEVISSLFIGVFVGASVFACYADGVSGIFNAFFTVLDKYMLNALNNSSHVSVILFSVLIGSIVALISKNGGMQGVVNRIVRFATTRKSGMLTTYFLGIAIFFDDYANTLVVGNTMRSVTDRLRISREKLAYIVDSTAAPIAAIAFITTWIGAELTYISDGVGKISQNGLEISEGAYSIFINSLAYSFYPIFTLIFMFFMLYKQKDFGPMLQFERKAIKEGVDGGGGDDESTLDLKEFETKAGVKPKAYNALLPILTVVIGTIIGLVYTGLASSQAQILDSIGSFKGGVWNQLTVLDENATGFFRKLGIVIGNADSYAALLWSSLSGLGLAIILTVSQRIMNLRDTMESVMTGIKTMLPAIVILVLAWALAGVTEDLHTAEYLKSFFTGEFNQVWIIPSLTFVLSAIIAFSTGSSWSTMALMYPLVIPLSFTVATDALDYDATLIMYNTIASVLAGSVLGDHCSPISDTTILSSLASSCNHINHVKTQMPYALTVGGVALVCGIIPGAFGISSFITIPLGIVMLYLIVHFLAKNIENEETS